MKYKTLKFNGEYNLTSPYGWRTLGGIKQFHHGADFSMPVGVPIKALPYKWECDYISQLGDGGVRLYYPELKRWGWDYHNSKIMIKYGQKGTGGEVIALSGAVGNVTGPHLHTMITKSKSYKDSEDPLPYILTNKMLTDSEAQEAAIDFYVKTLGRHYEEKEFNDLKNGLKLAQTAQDYFKLMDKYYKSPETVGNEYWKEKEPTGFTKVTDLYIKNNND